MSFSYLSVENGIFDKIIIKNTNDREKIMDSRRR